MARRRQTIGGDEGDDIVDAYTQAYFKRGQQEDPRMAMAMQLMGLQQSQQEAALNREEKARAQQAEEMWRSGQLGLEREKLGVTKSEAESAAKAREGEAKAREEERAFREGTTTRDIQYKMDQAQREAEKSRTEQENKNRENKATAIWRLANQQVISPERARAEWDALYPENVEIAANMKEQALGEAVTQNLERFKGMKPEARKAMLQNPVEMQKIGGVEGYKRIMAQLGPNADQPAPPERGFWSKMFSGFGEPGAAATTPTGPPQLNTTIAGGYQPGAAFPRQMQPGVDVQSVASAPPGPSIQMPQTVGYGQDAAGPEWRYGTGNQAIPQAPIAVPQVPRSTVIDDLLMKAMQGGEAQAQDMPWLYGGQSWPTSRSIPGPTPLPRELLQ